MQGGGRNATRRLLFWASSVNGAESGNLTRILSLENSRSTTELSPREIIDSFQQGGLCHCVLFLRLLFLSILVHSGFVSSSFHA